MAGGKLSARQKMINMMYLVLTALLALNVTKEILLAFTVLDNSLQKSTSNIEVKTNKIMDQLKKNAQENNLGAKAALGYCTEAANETKRFVEDLHNIKTELMRYVQGAVDPKDANIDPGKALKVVEEHKEEYKFMNQYPWVLKKNGEMPELVSGDNLDDHVRYFNEEKSGERGKALEASINKTRVKLLSLFQRAMKDPNLGKNPETVSFLTSRMNDIALKTTLSAGEVKDPFKETSGPIKDHEGKELSWSEVYMHSTPLAAVFAMLSKIENDAKILETEVCQSLAEAVSAADFKFDAIIPVVSAKTGAVVTGQTYEADILLAAYNSKAEMRVTVNGSAVQVEDGVGKYKVTPQSPGTNNLNVSIRVPKPGGGEEVKEAKAEFTAFAPQAAISADALNVLYVGLPNPISISVGGVDPSNVMVRIVGCQLRSDGTVTNEGAATNAVISGGKGKYAVSVPKKIGDCQIQVAAKLPDGRVKPMGNKNFKIRNVPKPRFKCGAVEFVGSVSADALRLQPSASAVLDNFVYDGVRFKVLSYKFMAVGRRTNGPKFATCNSASLDPIKPILGMLGQGDIVQFSDIRAVGPDGVPVMLANESATIK